MCQVAMICRHVHGSELGARSMLWICSCWLHLAFRRMAVAYCGCWTRHGSEHTPKTLLSGDTSRSVLSAQIQKSDAPVSSSKEQWSKTPDVMHSSVQKSTSATTTLIANTHSTCRQLACFTAYKHPSSGTVHTTDTFTSAHLDSTQHNAASRSFQNSAKGDRNH